MNKVIIATVVLMLWLISFTSFAAPYNTRPPVTLEGTVKEITWHSEEFRQGIPRRRADSTIPAHYVIGLDDITITGEHKSESEFKDGDAGRIRFRHESDDGYLMPGMRIRLTDFCIRGDEWGDWAFFTSIEVH